MSFQNSKLRILAIHGYRQSDKTFSAKLGSLRKSFKREVDFVFIKAPHRVPCLEVSHCTTQDASENSDDTEQYGWWFNTQDRIFKATEPSDTSVGFDESLEIIKNAFSEQGPFDGILGFSQGGSFVSILCAIQQKKALSIEFDFAIIISGFKSLCCPHQIYYDQQMSLPTLHVYGDGDQVIPTRMAQELSDLFIKKQVMVHEGGHYVPGKKHIYNDFLKEMSEKKFNNDDKKSDAIIIQSSQ